MQTSQPSPIPTTRDGTATAPDHAAITERSGPYGQIGRRRFLQAVGATAAFGAVAAARPDGTVVAAVTAGASQFVPLTQVKRVLDTRTAADYEFTRFGATHVRVPLAGKHGIPVNATAVVATVTAVNLDGPNWVTVVPSSTSVPTLLAQNRLVSTLNLSSFGEASANLTQVKIGPDGVDVVSMLPCEMIVDVIGYYRAVTGPVREGRFIGLPAARRAIDTRDTFGYLGAGQTMVVDLTAFVPPDASSVVVNLTATECAAPGFLTAFSATSPVVPDASSLNVNAVGETRAAAVVVPITNVNGTRSIVVYTLQPAKVIVDVTGYFTGASSPAADVGLFVPVDPVRILDTRDPGQIGRLWTRWTVEGGVPGAGASSGSIVVNLTAVNSRQAGYLTISSARVGLPTTSNVNFAAPGMVVPNHAITPVTSGYGFQVFAEGGAHVLVDYLGYYTGSPAAALIGAPSNPHPPAIGPEWILDVPAIGLRSRVLAGNADRVTNSGHSWHWTGTGYLGQGAHVAVFGHRTSAGGPYRDVHYLSGGDRFTVTTLDNREYTYEVVRRDLTNSVVRNILDATRYHPGTTFSLIACTRTDFQPTSTSYRIVVTGELIGWREIV